MPSHDRWLNESEVCPQEVDRLVIKDFLLPRVPVRYDDWGITIRLETASIDSSDVADVPIQKGTTMFSYEPARSVDCGLMESLLPRLWLW